MGKFIDLTGQTFGRLTVIKRAENDHKGRVRWLCSCSCGNSNTVITASLTTGNTTSCGCAQRDAARKSQTKHNSRWSRLYKVWLNMKNRCRNRKTRQFKDYGGRGVTVCSDWHNFIPFQEWAYSNGYSDELTLDRIDVDGDYCPENCRWVTMKEQCRNKRNNRKLTFNGETKCLAEWSDVTGVSQSALKYRLNSGWSPERTLNTPTKKRGGVSK